MIKYINGVINAPQAIGPYSQAVVVDNFIYLSGQIPIDPKTQKLVEGSIELQTEQVMKNILAILGFVGVDFNHIIKTTIFLTDLKNFQTVNQTYSKWLGGIRPARSTVQVAALPLGSQIEIEAVAVLELNSAPMKPEGYIEDLQKMASEYGCC
jgi:2-iminobutanoate/2-iminopropanoate deaminase